MMTNQHNLKQQYSRFYYYIYKAIQTGKSTTYSTVQKQGLHKRLHGYENRLKYWSIAVASAATLFFAQMTAFAQSPVPVGTEFQVNTQTIYVQNEPSVAMDSNGNFVVTWYSYGQDGEGFGIYAQRYNSVGIVQGSEFQVNTYTTSNQIYPSVAMDSDGNFVITWESYGQGGIYAQRYNSIGVAQGTEFRVNITDTTSGESYPSVAMDSNGNFVITWGSEQDGDGFGIYAQRYNSSGVAQGSTFQVNTYTINNQIYPSIAMDSNGDFVITWSSYGQDGSGRGIYAQRYNSSGVAQSSEFQVNTYTINDQNRPSVAMDNNGNFVVAWHSYGQDGNDVGIYAQRYDNSGTAQGSEFQVNTYTTSTQAFPSVAMDSDGDFDITWSSNDQDGNASGIYAQSYNSSGVAQGIEFKVNTYTVSGQNLPNIAKSNYGNFVIAWHSYGQDGSDVGIYAQLYSSSVPVEMLYFTGKTTKNGNFLTWATASEENNAGFEIQKSTDGRTFEKIAFVEGNGTTVEQQQYEFLDKNTTPTAYYRLKQTDFDGKFEYSNVIILNNTTMATAEVLVYPNPVSDVLTIENALGFATIYNALGQPLQQFEITNAKYLFNTNDLSKGIYTLQIRKTNGEITTHQIIK
jgi:hypothetical protein